MRDPNRINRICDELAAIWHMCPDLRLAQIMCNAMRQFITDTGRDPFYVEDDEFIEFLARDMKEWLEPTK